MTIKNKQTTGQKPNNTVSKAAALKYDGSNSPKLIAKGEGLLAQEIVSLAEKNDVHVHYDPLLLDVLTRLELGDEIPEVLYLAVAKIIAFAYYLQGKHPTGQATKTKATEDTILQLSSSQKVQENQPHYKLNDTEINENK